MREFKYIAVNSAGKRIEGTHKSETVDSVASWLQSQGLTVISVQENVLAQLKSILNFQIGGVPLKEKVIFARQLSTMIGASLPILQALDILVQQTKNENLRGKLETVYMAVESGSSLADAFAREKTMFSELQINLLRAGEKTGKMNLVMERIAVDMEKTKKLRSRIINALIYPAVILIVMVGVFFLLVAFMVPAVKGLYADFGVKDLPFITQALVSLSEVLTNPLGLVTFLFIIVSIVLGSRYYYNTYFGRRYVDMQLLKLPVVGDLITKIQLAQFCRLLSMLLQSGVPIVDTLRTIATAMGNSLFQDLVNYAAQEVSKGANLTVPLSKAEIFPITLLKILATGEITGKLDQISADMGKYYEEEVDDTTANLTKLIEPLILLFVGGLVALIAVAIYLPIYSLGQFVQ
jgi:type IV pilus assembly protein PilC